jgi:hypothetical protein
MSPETYAEVMAFRAATKHLEGQPESDDDEWVGGVHVPAGCTMCGGKVYLGRAPRKYRV